MGVVGDKLKNPNAYKRVVIKIGSALLVDAQTGLRKEWLNNLCDDISQLTQNGVEVLIVSSGAIAMGRKILNLPKGTLKLEQSQAAASVGQIELGRAYNEGLQTYDLSAGQILLTLSDTETRRRYLNARATINALLEWKAIPIINENDSVATSEIRYGDNDRLAARVATMVSADLLILLSDIDGLYTAPPHFDPNAELIEEVPEITSDIEAMAGAAASELSRGGMVTKIEAGKIATEGGTAMIITSGKEAHPIKRLINGANATWFAPSNNPVTARKRWIAGHLNTGGQIIVDEGAENALMLGKSLLFAGLTRIEGQFKRGDTVKILSHNNRLLGHGIIAYDAADAQKLIGHNSNEIIDILGYKGRNEVIHRDDMVLTVE